MVTDRQTEDGRNDNNPLAHARRGLIMAVDSHSLYIKFTVLHQLYILSGIHCSNVMCFQQARQEGAPGHSFTFVTEPSMTKGAVSLLSAPSVTTTVYDPGNT